jgi:ABC-type antimicrobial peptide transport system permease subunit
MKIKGWEKISGFTYKGYSIVNPIHNAEETNYQATILNFNLPHKPKWELSVLTPGHKFRTGLWNTDTFFIILRDDNKFNVNHEMTKQMMKSISNFRQTFEEMVDEILKIQLTSAPQFSSHSFNVNGTQRMHINSNGHATIGSGIINNVNNNGTTIPYGQMVQSIQSMQQTITNLTNDANNK